MRDRLIPLAAALALAGPPASAALSLVEAGIVCPELRETVERRPAPGTESGFVDIIEDPIEFDLLTRDVPLIQRLGFGLRVRSDYAEETPVTVVVEHPPFGERAVSVERWDSSVAAGSGALNIFTFDERYEMVPGAWTFAVEVDGTREVEVTFNVGTDPEPVDDACLEMLSV